MIVVRVLWLILVCIIIVLSVVWLTASVFNDCIMCFCCCLMYYYGCNDLLCLWLYCVSRLISDVAVWLYFVLYGWFIVRVYDCVMWCMVDLWCCLWSSCDFYGWLRMYYVLCFSLHVFKRLSDVLVGLISNVWWMIVLCVLWLIDLCLIMFVLCVSLLIHVVFHASLMCVMVDLLCVIVLIGFWLISNVCYDCLMCSMVELCWVFWLAYVCYCWCLLFFMIVLCVIRFWLFMIVICGLWFF